MMVQIGLESAMRGYLAGSNVKVVDFEEYKVVDFEVMLDNFSEGVSFFADDESFMEYKPGRSPEELDKRISDLQGEKEALEEKLRVLREAYNELANASGKEAGEEAAQETAGQPAGTPKRKANGKRVLEEDEERCRKRQITDIGKLRALANAGWDPAKIASEFNVSESTVRETMAREKIA